jgi:hypothetical protein
MAGKPKAPPKVGERGTKHIIHMRLHADIGPDGLVWSVVDAWGGNVKAWKRKSKPEPSNQGQGER